MSKFALQESVITIRGQSVRVRELTHGERGEIAKGIGQDKFRGPALFVSKGSVEPTFTEEEAANEPADVMNAIAHEVMRLSGMLKDEKEGDEPKKD